MTTTFQKESLLSDCTDPIFVTWNKLSAVACCPFAKLWPQLVTNSISLSQLASKIRLIEQPFPSSITTRLLP